jgi:hypothetical protein
MTAKFDGAPTLTELKRRVHRIRQATDKHLISVYWNLEYFRRELQRMEGRLSMDWELPPPDASVVRGRPPAYDLIAVLRPCQPPIHPLGQVAYRPPVHDRLSKKARP